MEGTEFNNEEYGELFTGLIAELKTYVKWRCRYCTTFFGRLAKAGLTMAKNPCEICRIPKLKEDWMLDD